jgi:hypothetical protein
MELTFNRRADELIAKGRYAEAESVLETALQVAMVSGSDIPNYNIAIGDQHI